MRITEIYTSIQGETAEAGRPCVLVRTTGCDLRCTYCDTAHAFYGGRDWTLDEVMAEVARQPAKLVLLTGGEPLLQRELAPLAERLLAAGYEVMCETGGSHDVAVLPAPCAASSTARRLRAARPGVCSGRISTGGDCARGATP